MTAPKRLSVAAGLLAFCLPLSAANLDRRIPLKSAAAIVVDQRTGEALLQKQPGAVQPIASITKLMTAMVVLDAKQDLGQPMSIAQEDVDTLRNSKSRLPVGAELNREQALVLALMSSENRAAHALGRYYPGGKTACVAAMNAKAKALGLKDTRFEDTSGLSGNNVSSPQDLARLVNAAYQYPQIRDYSTRMEMDLPHGRKLITFHNTNALVQNSRWNIGLSKTGYIEEAGRCLVMQAELAARPVLIVLLDSWGKFSRIGDAQRIKDWLEGPAPKAKKRR